MCACVRASVHACMRVCVCECVHVTVSVFSRTQYQEIEKSVAAAGTIDETALIK